MSDIQLVNTRFGEDTDGEINQFIFEQLEWLIDSHKQLHNDRIPKQRKLYDGIPATETKSFPWPNSCYTLDTEVLTDSGWKPVATVTTLDKVLSRAPNGRASFEAVAAIA